MVSNLRRMFVGLITTTMTTQQELKSVIKTHIKQHYGSDAKMGSMTHESWTDVSKNYMSDLISNIDSLSSDELNIKYIDNYMSSFDFNGKIYVKYTPAVIIKSSSFRLVFNPFGRMGVELYKIHVFKKGNGIGSMIMDMINHVSTKRNTTVYLRPVPFDNTSIEQLRKFYQRHGFKRCVNSLYWSNK